MMVQHVFTLFLVVMGCISTSLAQDMYQPICDTDNFMTAPGDPDLPVFPSKFYYSMEANIVERQSTTFASEYFDEEGNRGRFDFVSSGSKTTSIYDYNLQEAFVFPNLRTGQDCSVNLLTTNTTSPTARFLFGIVPGVNNTVHIGAPSFIFYNSINTSRVNYMGMENSTRGIPSYRWQTCVTLPNNSYTLDYYFTNNNLWNNSYAVTGYIPVTIVLRGRRVRNGEVYNTEHYYNFVEYRTGSDGVPDDVFMVPTGLICAGRIPGKPLPALPDFFSAGIEVVYNANGTSTPLIQTYQEYYDYTHNLFRIDAYYPTFFNGSFSNVQDFNAGAVHILHPDFGYCETYPLSLQNAAFDANVDSQGNLYIRTAQELFYAQDSNQYIYEGVTTVRGIQADVWIAQNFTSNLTRMGITFYNINYQLFFSRPGQVINTVHGVTTQPVLLQTLFKSDSVSANGTIGPIVSQGNVYSFYPMEPPLDVFDVSACYTDQDFVPLRMRVNADQTHFNQNNVRQNIRQSIVSYADSVGMALLSPLQVNSIRFHVQGKDNSIHIYVQISNISTNATKKWNYSASKLVGRILQGVKNGDSLPFKIRIGDTDYTAYYYEETSDSSQSSRLSNNVVVGISIGTFVVGLVVGIIAIILIHFCSVLLCKGDRGSANFTNSRHSETSQYERQINDLPPTQEGVIITD